MDEKLWNQVCMQKIQANEQISDKMIEFFSTFEEKYIFGTNRQAAVCLELCRNMKVEVNGLIVTDVFCDKSIRKGYWKELVESIPFYTLEQIRKKNTAAYILMTVGTDYYDKSERVLREFGFMNIYRCEWSSNQVLRQIAFDAYKTFYEEWEKRNK